MSKRNRSHPSHSSVRKGKRKSNNAWSFAIPVVVGLVVVAIIVGAILSIENQRSTTAAMGDISVPVITAQAQPTAAIPYPNVPRISLEETEDGLEKGELVLVDVRDKRSFDTLHAEGAISIPEEEAEARSDELPRDKDVVFYCS